MVDIFEAVDKFFSSFRGYDFTYNVIFIIFSALFLFTVFAVIISTSHAYEAKLVRAIDMFNNYFLQTPQITEDNLVTFNNSMKSKKVPKLLRKQWQQFVLYRENKASHYMSFETCVSAPLRNSTFKRDISVMNIISYILAFLCFLLNIYSCYEDRLFDVLKHTLLCPILILVLNYVITIILDLRHNAIVSDLHQNYQFFEVNMDKATRTLPEYVDYEVLFDKNEIKRGIPILYAYLQRRAEEEQRELERARLRNVEHEKFNFDEAGVESSLVLERAMQEAENYIAERKKFMQDMEQINNEITQEELNFRETTKEYQRQMQVSKESFDNFKAQLAEASSSIEANYLKKQQQQELDRQRNLERDYDTATDRHKKILQNYQEELTAVENEIKGVRQNLERGMMSEFDTYSNKVYEAAYSQVNEQEKKKVDQLKAEIEELKKSLGEKDNELNDVKTQNQTLNEQLNNVQTYTQPETYAQPVETYNYVEETPIDNSQYVQDVQEYDEPVVDNTTEEYIEEPQYEEDYSQDLPQEEYIETPAEEYYEQVGVPENYEDQSVYTDEEEYAPVEQDFTIQEESVKPKREAGRPRKEKVDKPKRSVGRPRKVVQPSLDETPSEPKKRGRPRKVEQVDNIQPAPAVEKKRGRPRKQVQPATTEVIPSEPKKRGRPRKVVQEPEMFDSAEEIDDIDEFLEKINNQIEIENAKIEETTKQLERNSNISKRRKK